MSANILAVPPGGKPPGADEGTPPPGQGWTVRVGLDFLSAHRTPLSAMGKLLALALDGLARLVPFAWASNAALAAELGISPRRCQELLVELEGAGWIAPVYLDARKRTRLGIALRRRVGPATPAADTPERLAKVEAAIRAGWRPDRAQPDHRHWLRELGQDGADAPTRDPAYLERREVRTPEREKPRQKNAPSSREKTKGKSKPAEAAPRDDQSSSRVEVERSCIMEPPAPSPEAEPPADASPPARLTAEERSRFLRLDPPRQARVRELAAKGDAASKASMRRILEPPPSAKPTPSAPTLPALTFADRCRAMEATGDRRLVSGFASALALNLGSRTDQRLFSEFVKLGERVCTGAVPARALIDAAEAAFRPGVRNHGAYLWTTIQRDPTCATGTGR